MKSFWSRLALLLMVCMGVGADDTHLAKTAGVPCAITTRSEPVGPGTISYNVAGSGPVLLLLHGLFASKEQWNDMLCRLAVAGFTAIAVDLPGYGKSTGYPLSDYRLGRQAFLLREFTVRLGIIRLDVAGSSMGGTIATLYARRYRHQVRSLAFIGAPLGIVPWGPDLRRALFRGINAFIPITGPQFELELSLLFVDPPSVPPAEKRSIIADYVARNRHYVQVWDIVNLYDDRLRHSPLPRLPTLIVWGALDRIYPVSGAASLHAMFPGSELHELVGAGHLLLMEDAGEASMIYLRFLGSECVQDAAACMARIH